MARSRRDAKRRVELLGYDVRWRKLMAFVISAAIAGLASFWSGARLAGGDHQ
ncbi:MAG TPA: hypothetical protein VH933_04090 [Aestuariivirgaceae bacterium]|jgi:ABC-type branched-subunit amino acid transport system permease subunit